MLEDHELKDKILWGLEKHSPTKPDSYISKESIADFYKVSVERSRKLLEEIYKDGYCSRAQGYGTTEFRYYGNNDTNPFLEKGGYTKLAQDQEERLNKEHQKLQLEINHLVDKISDYDETKRKANRSFIISIVTVILLLLTTAHRLMCNKPD